MIDIDFILILNFYYEDLHFIILYALIDYLRLLVFFRFILNLIVMLIFLMFVRDLYANFVFFIKIYFKLFIVEFFLISMRVSKVIFNVR
jgi:hypothetical protein